MPALNQNVNTKTKIMKKILIPLLMLAMVSFTITDAPLTKAEREFASNLFTTSANDLQAAVKGLSTAQLNFKATSESWSIAECTEHIALSEINFHEMVQGVLKTDADPSKRADVKVTDEQLINMIEDRTNKVKTQKPFEPTGKFGSQEATLTAFMDKRNEHIKFVESTDVDLRNRYQQLPFGTIDGYQVLLFIAAHTERHIKQIEEVKANPGFPKS